MPSGSNTRRRWTTRLAISAVAACLLAVAAVAPASAIVTEVPTLSGTVKIGAQPRSVELLTPGAPVASFKNSAGHSVMHSNATYAIYWDPAYLYHGDWQHLIDTFLQNVGSDSGTLSNVFSLDEQYTDKSNQRAAYASSFRGAYVDTSEYPKASVQCKDPDETVGYPDPEAEKDNVACITDTQIREQLEEFITHHGLQTGMGTVFILLTPPGVTVCADQGGLLTSHCSDTLKSASGFCSYHSAISPANPTEGNAETILYDVIPWSAGGLGDAQLFDHAPGYECQDGGWNPAGKKGEEREEGTESAHQQEPNQLSAGVRSPDGSFDTGLADLIVNQVAVELQNTITDPLLNAWQDASGNEAMDECRNFFAATLGGSVGVLENTEAGTLFNQSIGSGHYYLNDTFNLAALMQGYPGIGCLPGSRLEPQFTSPNPVNAGEIVGFDAAESDVTLDAGTNFNATGQPYETFPTYTWSFGDGTHTTSAYPPGASATDEPSVFHSYQYGGTYTVTLTITDVGGNTRSTSRAIAVDGPPPPPPPPTTPSGTGVGTGTASTAAPSTSSTAASGSTAGSGSTSATTPGTALAAPAMTDSVMSRSLKKAASLGLALRYTVNEQVAGRVEAILDAATARRLHIKARTAFGLPQGYPQSVVVGQAVLVTTMGGHGVVRVRFSKAIAKRLAHAGHVTLTLRFVVRNASRTSPQTTTTLSTVVLSH